MDYTETTLSSAALFTGKIISVRRDVIRQPDGRESWREVVEHPGGVAILPLCDNGDVLLVRQYRYPHRMESLEIPAGKLERGESHYEAGLRELSEETGCTAASYEYLGPLWPSPGYCDEVLHLYLARGLTVGAAHPDDGELLNVERMPLAELLDRIAAGKVPDAKTAAAAYMAWRRIADDR